MPFPLKIQPVDFSSRAEPGFSKPVVKSRFKKLFERPFGNVLRSGGPEKMSADGGNDEFEPSSVCLANMVRNFIEESGDKQNKCSRSKCYCFNNSDSDDEFDPRDASACEVIKNLVLGLSVSESNLSADIAKIVDMNNLTNCTNDYIRKSVTDGLIALGYDASICKSRWAKDASYPAGEYEYVDVLNKDQRLIVDIDFRSEFEIARSTKKYKAILQMLPEVFVGEADRLQKIISLVADATKQSLKKKGMSLPPWRRADYVKSKWLSPTYTRTFPPKQPQGVAPPSPTFPPKQPQGVAPAPPSPTFPATFPAKQGVAPAPPSLTFPATFPAKQPQGVAPAPPSPTFPSKQPKGVAPPSPTLMDSTDSTALTKNLFTQTDKTTTSSVIPGVKSSASSDHSDTVFSMSED